jgi:hypothetical protein
LNSTVDSATGITSGQRGKYDEKEVCQVWRVAVRQVWGAGIAADVRSWLCAESCAAVGV